MVDYIASKRWEESQVEIFMDLKERILEPLVSSGASPSTSIANLIFLQMLPGPVCP